MQLTVYSLVIGRSAKRKASTSTSFFEAEPSFLLSHLHPIRDDFQLYITSEDGQRDISSHEPLTNQNPDLPTQSRQQWTFSRL